MTAMEAAKEALRTMRRRSHRESGVMFGAPFLRFLLAWGGMHAPPWPVRTVAQARSIVRGAADYVRGAEEGWERTATVNAAPSLSYRLSSSSSSPEALLLAPREADAERRKLLSGVTSRGRGSIGMIFQSPSRRQPR